MRYHKITYPDVNNGDGCRVTLWLSGCSHHCEGCHNPETWNPMGGIAFTEESYAELAKILLFPYIKGLTLSGGDPLYSYDEVLLLAERVKRNFPEKDIWLYTGYCFCEIKQLGMEKILDYVDVIVDGKYVKELRDLSLPFCGSSNQHILMRLPSGEWAQRGNFV